MVKIVSNVPNSFKWKNGNRLHYVQLINLGSVFREQCLDTRILAYKKQVKVRHLTLLLRQTHFTHISFYGLVTLISDRARIPKEINPSLSFLVPSERILMLILSSARPPSNSGDSGSRRTTKIPHRRGKNSKTRDRYPAELTCFLSVLSHIIYNQERRRVRGDV